MGRYDTVAWSKIHAICVVHQINEEELKKRSRLILSAYSKLMAVDVEEDYLVIESGMIEKDPIKAVERLEKIPADMKEQELFTLLRDSFDRAWFVEIVDTAMVGVKHLKDSGDLYFEILSKCYLSKNTYDDTEMMEELDISRPRFYDRKREAVMFFGILFWYKALPCAKKYLCE